MKANMHIYTNCTPIMCNCVVCTLPIPMVNLESYTKADGCVWWLGRVGTVIVLNSCFGNKIKKQLLIPKWSWTMKLVGNI